MSYYLINGTGYAWTLHNNAKFVPTCFSNVKLFDSAENVGFFEATGSE